MKRLAEGLGDTVYLSVRSGFDGICIERTEGSYPIRTCTVEVGVRRPLGVGAGNLALLAATGDIEANTIIEHCAPRYPDFGMTEAGLREKLEMVREQGFIYQDAVTSSAVKATALPIKGRTGHPFGALSMTAIADRMPEDRVKVILEEMRREIETIEHKISELGYV
jgi:DNA-binding IclR family transcriptional regulator